MFLRAWVRGHGEKRWVSNSRRRRPSTLSAVRATSSASRVDRSTWRRDRRLLQDSLRRGDKPFTLSLFARQLVTPTQGFGSFADTSFGGFLISPAPFHFAKEAFTLQPLLEHPQGLIDIVVFYEDAQNSSDLKVAAIPRPQCVRSFERSGVTPEKPYHADAHGFPSCATVERLSSRRHIATTMNRIWLASECHGEFHRERFRVSDDPGPLSAKGELAADMDVRRSGSFASRPSWLRASGSLPGRRRRRDTGWAAARFGHSCQEQNCPLASRNRGERSHQDVAGLRRS